MDIIPPPSPEERAFLLAHHARRHPQPVKIPVIDDHGARATLTVLLGLPAGACRRPKNERPSAVWSRVVAEMLTGAIDVSNHVDDLVADCVLWPEPRVFASWRERWPKISGDIAQLALRMAGVFKDAIHEMSLLDEQPEPLAQPLADNPRAVWTRVTPPQAHFDVAINTPSAVQFDAFSAAIGQPDADKFALCREFAEAQVLAVAGADGEVVTTGEMFDRFPGLVVRITALSRALAGVAGEVQLGEW